MSTKDFIVPTTTVYKYINFIWVVTVFIVSIKVLVTIVNPTDIQPRINYKIEEAGQISSAVNQNFSIYLGEGQVKFPKDYTPPTSMVVINHLTDLIGIGLTLFILFQIRAIVKEAIHNNPLNYKNSHRLLQIGWAIIAIGVVSSLSRLFDHYSADYILNECLSHERSGIEKIDTNRYSFTVTLGRIISGESLLTGLLVIAISSVFKKGALMKEEADLTI